MIERNIAAIILINEHNEVLLQKKDLRFKRWPWYWSFFGGGIEWGEIPEETLKRELKEEIWYELNDAELFTVYDYEDSDRQGKMHIFTAKFNAPISSISIWEGIGFAFFAENEVNGLKIIDHDMIILKKFFSEK